jgi:Xaa-Pro aminopeptidase
MECRCPAEDLTCYITRLGPVGRALSAEDEQTRTKVLEAVRPAFDRYRSGGEIRFTAACWLISARAEALPEQLRGA